MTKVTRTAKITEANETNNDWKCDAFINTYLKHPKSGKLAKVGKSIRLYKDNPVDAMLISRYTRDPELVSEMDTDLFVHTFALANNSESKSEFTEDDIFG